MNKDLKNKYLITIKVFGIHRVIKRNIEYPTARETFLFVHKSSKKDRKNEF